VSDSNVAFEKESGVLRTILTAARRLSICVLLTHFVVVVVVVVVDVNFLGGYARRRRLLSG